MHRLELMKRLSVKTGSKILFFILDGLGGIPWEGKGESELEAARTPNMDALAARSSLGLMDPIAPGVTPGSGPGHLGLFGYDPLEWDVGRGVVAALGIGLDLSPSDVAARGNFCTVDEKGRVTDRRAGRIPTSTARELCRELEGLEFDGARIETRPVRDHRCSVVFRGEGLDGRMDDTDPQKEGVPPKEPRALHPEAARTEGVVRKYLEAVWERIKDRSPANMLMLRGFDRRPTLPSMRETFKLDPAAIAVYPDYKGISRLAGMKVYETSGETVSDELDVLEKIWPDHDFVYLHVKKTDSHGEDGNFDAKVATIEEADGLLPRILALKPDVLIVTGDHSTPSVLKAHSWHPLPLLIHSPYVRRGGAGFSERECAGGALGRIEAADLMPLAMANALKLKKYGA